MGMPAVETEWTVDMVRAIPDDNNRYEVVDGELFVTPAPSWRHGDVIAELHLILAEYVKQNSVAHVKLAPQDVVLDHRTLVEPDIFVVPLIEGRKPRAWEEVREMLLVIEVLSPSTARLDRRVKRDRYQREGVPEYWIVDLDARIVERWRAGDERPDVISGMIEWRPVTAPSPLVLDLDDLFARALD
ncbi:MAG: Uma2 family endonuclease [Gemmatimonadaceae bacterium]